MEHRHGVLVGSLVSKPQAAIDEKRISRTNKILSVKRFFGFVHTLIKLDAL